MDGVRHVGGNEYSYGGFLTCNENRWVDWKQYRRGVLREAKRDQTLKEMGVKLKSISTSRDGGYLGGEADVEVSFTLEATPQEQVSSHAPQGSREHEDRSEKSDD